MRLALVLIVLTSSLLGNGSTIGEGQVKEYWKLRAISTNALANLKDSPAYKEYLGAMEKLQEQETKMQQSCGVDATLSTILERQQGRSTNNDPSCVEKPKIEKPKAVAPRE